jgi:thioredoxin 1
MSKTIVAGLVIAALLLGGYLYSSNQKVTEVADQSPVAETMGKTETVTDSKQYFPYTAEVLENAKPTRRVLFFYASWCPTCIPANADFEKNVSQLPSDVTVIRVNYNDGDTDADEKALAAKYGVTYQHTYVQIDAEGNEITKWNGGSTKELLAKIK